MVIKKGNPEISALLESEVDFGQGNKGPDSVAMVRCKLEMLDSISILD
jgi:hypothetical protein